MSERVNQFDDIISGCELYFMNNPKIVNIQIDICIAVEVPTGGNNMIPQSGSHNPQPMILATGYLHSTV